MRFRCRAVFSKGVEVLFVSVDHLTHAVYGGLAGLLQRRDGRRELLLIQIDCRGRLAERSVLVRLELSNGAKCPAASDEWPCG